MDLLSIVKPSEVFKLKKDMGCYVYIYNKQNHSEKL